MTRVEVAREIRAALDQESPGWRETLRREMDKKEPGWVVAGAKVLDPDGKVIEVALLANPERVPEPSEIDPATDPFAA